MYVTVADEFIAAHVREDSALDGMKHPWRDAALFGIVVGTTQGLLWWISGYSLQFTLLLATLTAISWFLS